MFPAGPTTATSTATATATVSMASSRWTAVTPARRAPVSSLRTIPPHLLPPTYFPAQVLLYVQRKGQIVCDQKRKKRKRERKVEEE